jgi:hypothetical protein
MRRVVWIVALSVLLVDVSPATALAKNPKFHGSGHRGQIWIRAESTREAVPWALTVQPRAQVAQTTQAHLLPMLTFSMMIGGQAFCGGGRALVACQLPTNQPAAAAPLPHVTPGLVLTAMRRIGLPALAAHTQPAGKTLVNFATIFYTDPLPFSRTVTLLGRQVTIVATPQTFTWHYGDGMSSSTSTPGAPYPAKDVTHSYQDAHRTVLTSVDVSYSARFRVGGEAWQDIPGTVTIAGPTSPLRISEATALLSGDYH